MKIIVGLGNPEERHEDTRHNVGFMAVDGLLRKLTPVEKTTWKKSRKFNALIAKIKDLFLVKPLTFMNASGFTVAKLAFFYKIEPGNIWLIHDDIDLPLGKIKIRQSGSPGGHRGVKSIIDNLGTDQFVRFRIGVGHPGPGSSKKEVEDYVLDAFRPAEKVAIKKAIKKTIAAIETALQENLEKTMNKFNMR